LQSLLLLSATPATLHGAHFQAIGASVPVRDVGEHVVLARPICVQWGIDLGTEPASLMCLRCAPVDSLWKFEQHEDVRCRVGRFVVPVPSVYKEQQHCPRHRQYNDDHSCFHEWLQAPIFFVRGNSTPHHNTSVESVDLYDTAVIVVFTGTPIIVFARQPSEV